VIILSELKHLRLTVPTRRRRAGVRPSLHVGGVRHRGDPGGTSPGNGEVSRHNPFVPTLTQMSSSSVNVATRTDTEPFVGHLSWVSSIAAATPCTESQHCVHTLSTATAQSPLSVHTVWMPPCPARAYGVAP
jgi:hypothetical protein